METGKAIEIYEILDKVVLTDLDTASQFVILDNLMLLKPVAETFKADIALAAEKTKPEKLEEMLKKVDQHNKAVSKKEEEGKMSAEEIEEINEMYQAFNEKMFEREKQLKAADCKITLQPLLKKEFGKLIKANEKMEAGKIAILYDALC